MKVVAGLGNPGPEYQLTRHNAGVWLVEKLAEKLESNYGWRAEKEAMVFRSGGWILARPKDKFMNQSGEWVKWLMEYGANRVGLENLWVVHDDLDIRLGEYKIQFGTGPKDHNGINSVEAVLGGAGFWRVRLGIDNRVADNRITGEEYVLEKFAPVETEKLGQAIEAAVRQLLSD